jgi:hypothetical protein
MFETIARCPKDAHWGALSELNVREPNEMPADVGACRTPATMNLHRG